MKSDHLSSPSEAGGLGEKNAALHSNPAASSLERMLQIADQNRRREDLWHRSARLALKDVLHRSPS